MPFDSYLIESFLNAKFKTFWNEQVHDSLDFFTEANDEEHSDLSFIYKIDNFSIIHHYENTPVLPQSDVQKKLGEIKKKLSCENKQTRIEEEELENSMNKQDNIGAFWHDSLEKDSNDIQNSTRIQELSKKSSILSDASKVTPSQFSRLNSRKSEKRRPGRKPENLGLVQRKDVVLKTILRNIRSWFLKDLSSFAGLKMMKNNENVVIYSEWLKKYSKEKFSSNQSQTFLFYLSSLMSSKNTEQQVSLDHGLFYEAEEKKRSKQLAIVMKVHSLLYKFSYTKLKKLLKNKDL
jgi:hypothetical protein